MIIGKGELPNEPTCPRQVSNMCKGGKDRGGMLTQARGTAIYGKLVRDYTTNARGSSSLLLRCRWHLPRFRRSTEMEYVKKGVVVEDVNRCTSTG
jgi:hypothetical protein